MSSNVKKKRKNYLILIVFLFLALAVFNAVMWSAVFKARSNADTRCAKDETFVQLYDSADVSVQCADFSHNFTITKDDVNNSFKKLIYPMQVLDKQCVLLNVTYYGLQDYCVSKFIDITNPLNSTKQVKVLDTV